MEALVATLGDSSAQVRMSAGRALASLGRSDPMSLAPHAEELAKFLRNPMAQFRIDVVEALATLGHAAEPYVPEIASLLEDRDGSVRLAAATALGYVGNAAVPYAA